LSNKSIIEKVIKQYFETGHLSENILKDHKEIKEEKLLKIYKNRGNRK
jgi:hypothetical protein